MRRTRRAVRPSIQRPDRSAANDAFQCADAATSTQLDVGVENRKSNFGRPSIPPEKLLRALLLQALYTIRSERLLMEQLDYNLLFRCFVGLGMDDAVWSPTTFTKNRDRSLRVILPPRSSTRC